MGDPAKELIFQNEVIAQMVAAGWQLGDPVRYNRVLALYPEDVVGFVQDAQPEQWQKFCTLYPSYPEQKFLERVAEQLDKADPNAADKACAPSARSACCAMSCVIAARCSPTRRKPPPSPSWSSI